MKIFFTAFLLLLACFSAFSQEITPPKNKLAYNDLDSKSISELWLLRNSIFAKYGRPFKTYELHFYFMSCKWYKIRTDYKQSDLNETDIYNVDLLSKKETELLQHNFVDSKVNYNNIFNTFQYPDFTDNEKDLISKNGFVVIPTNNQQLFHIYENNDYLGIPSFITTDLILQLYHLYFDMTLRTIEEDYLITILSNLLEQLITEHQNLLKIAKDKQVIEAINFNLAYLGVAQYFIDGEDTQIYGDYKEFALIEIKNCNSNAGWQESPLFKRKFDYSQYIPRGHYTRNQNLENFFKSMMWLGNAGIELEQEKNILSAVILTHILFTKSFKNEQLINLWRNIYEPTVFYVGLSDDTGPEEIKKEMDLIFAGVTDINDFNNSSKLLLLLKNLPSEKISGHGSWGAQKKQFRFMGQRFVPDSYVFHRLTDEKRKMPMSLDIMAAFGNDLAYKLMMNDFKSSWTNFPAYPDTLNKIISENNKISKEEWTQNFYYYWLYNLKSLYEIKDKSSLPFFMTTEGWQYKTLNTILASWAELRHNTILFVKESMAAECGGDGYEENVWIPEPPKGYVEPNIEFYKRMSDLMNFTMSELKKRDMLEYRIENIGVEFVDLLTFLIAVSEKEINNEVVTHEEYAQIQKIGSLVDNLTLRILSTDYSEWWEIEGPDKNMPVIADVHTADFDALEVGVGLAQEIYVVVEIEGRLKLTRGAIFSFYEFHQPVSERLTDEKWQEMLNSGNAPEQPSWIRYKSKSGSAKQIKPLYKPKDQTPDYSTTPGWNIIYYDTGC